ncbi:MAG: DUF721 domain-containing protein [Acidimicrobiales bacterium]|nr:DUF721 domain-containing protein [Acidimicrobiales bacterium]
MPWSRLPTPDAAGEPDPSVLGEVLDQVLAGIGAPRASSIVAVAEGWATIVGPELVAHTWPLAIEDGCLRVGVDSPAWASHLRWSEREVLGRIDRLVGAGEVRSVAARVTRR